MKVLSKMPGIPLPKRILRPFSYYENVKLDDKQYVLVAGHDKKELLAVLIVIPGVLAFGSIVFLLATDFQESVYFYALIFSILLAVSLKLLSKRIKPKKFTVFDREKGMVTIPRVFLPGPRLYAPWSEFTGRIILTSSSVGAARHELLLMHIPSSKGWFLDASILDVYGLLGYWSFLVQYMDKSQPLPDVADLSKYGETSAPLGYWKDWETLERSKGFSDPYYEWQAEVKQNPELDEVNHFIEQRVLGKV